MGSIAHSWRGGSNSIGIEIKGEPDARENILEHGDYLEGQHILAAVITDFEYGLLPHIILLTSFNATTVAIK